MSPNGTFRDKLISISGDKLDFKSAFMFQKDVKIEKS